MNNFKFGLTLLGARSVYNLIKILRVGEGTSFVGKMILKFSPNFVAEASGFVEGAKIAVSGTNGKTTTCGVVYHVLEQCGKKIVANRKGANMLTGIANAFALTLKSGKTVDNCVLECDEAYLERIQKGVKADFLLITNLFPDQVDRYSDVGVTRQKIQAGIDAHSAQVLLNADNPDVAVLKSDKKPLFYGVKFVDDRTGLGEGKLEDENFVCPVCSKKLNYSKRFYAQQGHFSCECGFSRPQPEFEADIVLEKEFSIIKLGEEEFKFPFAGLFNAYNALAAIALLKTVGAKEIKSSLLTYKTAFGRSEVREIDGKKVLIQLIKNPAGASQVLKSVDVNSKILIAINNNIADGTDISWLWDTDFSRLKNVTQKIVVSGLKAEDVLKRLVDAGVSKSNIEVVKEISTAIDSVLTMAENNITILPSYTALLEIDKLLKKF